MPLPQSAPSTNVGESERFVGDVEGVEDAGVPSSLLRSCRRPVKASATSRAIADHAKVGTTSTLFLGQGPSANDMDQTPTPAHPPSRTRPALSLSSLWFSRSCQNWGIGLSPDRPDGLFVWRLLPLWPDAACLLSCWEEAEMEGDALQMPVCDRALVDSSSPHPPNQTNEIGSWP